MKGTQLHTINWIKNIKKCYGIKCIIINSNIKMTKDNVGVEVVMNIISKFVYKGWEITCRETIEYRDIKCSRFAADWTSKCFSVG